MKKYLNLILFFLFLAVYKPYQICAQSAHFHCNQFNLDVFSKIDSINKLKDNFHAYTTFVMESKGVIEKIKSTNTFTLVMPNQEVLVFHLEEYNIFSTRFKIYTPQGIHDSKQLINFIKTYKGNLNNNFAHHVTLTITNNTLSIMYRLNGKDFYIEPLSKFYSSTKPDIYVWYSADDLNKNISGKCHAKTLHEEVFEHSSHRIKSNDEILASNCTEAEIAIAADFAYVQNYGGALGAETQIVNVLNMVNGLYSQSELGIEYKIAGLYLSNSVANDPWNTTTNADDLLTSFTNWGNNGGFGFNYDVASLWTDRNLFANGSNGIVGIAWIGGVCNRNRYNVLEDYSTNIRALMINQSHELGHNWNAQHASGANFIMNPTIGTQNDDWDATSISTINTFKNNAKCLSPCGPKAPLANFKSDIIYTCSGEISFTDLSLNIPTSWLWEFGDGKTSTQQNPKHQYTSSGAYTVSLTAKNDIGENKQTKTNFIQVNIINKPIASDATRCGEGNITLTAQGLNNFELQWYSSPTQGNLLASGINLNTFINATSTFYVQHTKVPRPLKVGPVDTSFALGANFNTNDQRGLLFDVFSPLTINSVKVYSSAQADRKIEILDKVGGAVLFSKIVNIPLGESRVTLNASLNKGKQYFMKITGPPVNLFRNSGGASFPYQIDGIISITETDVASTNPAFYYFFYDWEVQEQGCSSERTAVKSIDECQANYLENSASKFNLTIAYLPELKKLSISNIHQNENLYIELVDLLGKIHLTKKIDSIDSHEINLNHLTTNLYLLKITANSKVYTSRIFID